VWTRRRACESLQDTINKVYAPLINIGQNDAKIYENKLLF